MTRGPGGGETARAAKGPQPRGPRGMRQERTLASKMKAAIFVEKGRIVLEDKKIPDVGPNDALIRVTTTTISRAGLSGSSRGYTIIAP